MLRSPPQCNAHLEVQRAPRCGMGSPLLRKAMHHGRVTGSAAGSSHARQHAEHVLCCKWRHHYRRCLGQERLMAANTKPRGPQCHSPGGASTLMWCGRRCVQSCAPGQCGKLCYMEELHTRLLRQALLHTNGGVAVHAYATGTNWVQSATQTMEVQCHMLCRVGKRCYDAVPLLGVVTSLLMPATLQPMAITCCHFIYFFSSVIILNTTHQH